MYVLLEASGQVFIAKRRSDGSVDSAYGTNGLSLSAPLSDGFAAIQQDGKIVVVGTFHDAPYDFNKTALIRFNVDGRLDQSFAAGGRNVDYYDGSGYETPSQIVIKSDGKIVVCINSSTESDDYYIVSYNSDGSFNSVIKSNNLDGGHRCNSVAAQKDGKIIAAGYQLYENTDLVRFKQDKTLDSTFSDDGKQLSGFTNGIKLVITQADGKIVVTDGYAIIRYNINGSIDNIFNAGKKLLSTFSIASMTTQEDGKLVIVGSSNDNFIISRFNTNGSIDNTFSSDGVQTTDFAGSDFASSLAIATNGKIVVAGNASEVFAISKYNTNGTLDNTFSNDGKVTDYPRQQNTYYKTSVVQSDGKLVVGGSKMLVRYNTNGTLDNTFNKNGLLITNFSINILRIQKDGKIVAAGDSTMARYAADGSLDKSFSGDGKLTTNFSIISAAVSTDGRIAVAGNVPGGYSDGISPLARYNSDGSPDISFNNNGKQDFPFDINAINTQGDGKILVVGRNGAYFTVARYNTNGSLDNTFGEEGIQNVDFRHPGDGSDSEEGGEDNEFDHQIATSVITQTDGKIVVAGYWERQYRMTNSTFAIARLNTDGSLDNTFSNDGINETRFPNNYNYSNAYGNTLTIQNDGKIIVAGSSRNFNRNFSIARYNTNGNLDSAFGTGGIQITQVSGADNEIQSIAIADNRLYAVGYDNYPGNVGIVARYLLDANKPPVVSITNPVNNSVYYAPATINVAATATDPDGTAMYVEFYSGTTLLKVDYTKPYTLTWRDLSPGTYYLTAKATDNQGLTATTAPVKVTVLQNKPPVVNITNPVNNSVYNAPATINVAATATDPDGTAMYVQFYSGTKLLKTDSTKPYTLTWRDLTAGTYYLTAKATDNRGLSATTSPVKITVTNASSRPMIEVSKTAISLKLSPNPAKDILQVAAAGLQEGKPTTLSIISASGVVMKTIVAINVNQQINVSSLASGVYTLKVASGDKIVYKQFVKL